MRAGDAIPPALQKGVIWFSELLPQMVPFLIAGYTYYASLQSSSSGDHTGWVVGGKLFIMNTVNKVLARVYS